MRYVGPNHIDAEWDSGIVEDLTDVFTFELPVEDDAEIDFEILLPSGATIQSAVIDGESETLGILATWPHRYLRGEPGGEMTEPHGFEEYEARVWREHVMGMKYPFPDGWTLLSEHIHEDGRSVAVWFLTDNSDYGSE